MTIAIHIPDFRSTNATFAAALQTFMAHHATNLIAFHDNGDRWDQWGERKRDAKSDPGHLVFEVSENHYNTIHSALHTVSPIVHSTHADDWSIATDFPALHN